MNDKNDNIPPPARLSDSERADMLRGFLRYANAHPAREPRAARSPYFFRLLHSPAAYSLLIFLMLGGTAYAAEGSLPRDFLYPVKTGVIEPIAVQLAPLAGVEQDDAHIALVERRLDEAETLLDRKKLDGASVAVLSEKITESSSKVRKIASDAAKEGNISDALDASSDLETLLEGHKEVLSSAADDAAASSTVLDGLIDTVEEQGEQAEDASEDIEQQFEDAPAEASAQYAAALMDAASSSIRALEARLAERARAAGEDEDARAQAAALLKEANGRYQSGIEGAARRGASLPDWREAQSAAEKGLILIESSEDAERP